MNIKWTNEKELTRYSARRYGVCLCLMLAICVVCQAQRLDVKPYIIYHQSVSSQQEPVFFQFSIPSYPSSSGIIYSSAFRKDFTLATGREYGLAIDYTFHNQLGFELGLGYFSSISNPLDRGWLTIDWNYHSIAVRPLFSYAVTKGKSVFIGKVGPTVYLASATMNASFAHCTFGNRLSWGFATGLEYNYQLSKKWGLAMELGVEQYKYTPARATVEYKEIEKKNDEILYVNKMFREPMFDGYELSQKKRMKESILFNNIYFGIGIKYNLWVK